MFHVYPITVNQAQEVHDLVHQIYYPTYAEILQHDQIEFMLAKSYTVQAIKDAILSDQDFYILCDKENNKLGFMALKNYSNTILRIEKLYLLPQAQGKGAGKYLINFATYLAKKLKKKYVELNVNRANKAYFFYLKQGFKVIQEVDIPYYGYVLDDYVMQKSV